MADAPDKDDKTEAPTAKRRRESAEKGETFQSRELGTALVVGAGVVWAMTGAGALIVALHGIVRDGLMLADPLRIDPRLQPGLLTQALVQPLMVFAALVLACAVAGPLLTAPRFTPATLAPKFSRLNPIAGLQRMFGLHAVTELGKAVLKAALVFGTGGAVIAAALPGLVGLGAVAPAAGGGRVAAATSGLLLALGVALALVAAADFPLQLNRHLAKLRMSKHEIKQESRESDGSPETKAAQRRLARQAARRALAPAIASASVVVVNPAHFAVALRYVPERDTAPIVVAKGRDVIAEAIRELAAEHKVPMLRYPQLTRAIYFTSTIGLPIRDELFGAVAAVLAFVLALDDRLRLPEVDVPDEMRFDEFGKRR